MIPSLLAALFLLPAALSPDAQDALRRASSRYADGAAHEATFTHLYTPGGFTTPQRESGTIWIQTPQRLRFEYTKPEKKIFTYDAGEARLYAAQDKQLTIQKLSGEDMARLPVLFLTDPADTSRDYDVSVEGGAADGTLLLLRPHKPRPELAWLRVTIEKDGSISDISYENAAGDRTEFRFDRWRREKARPDGDYHVTGPAGTRVLEN